MILSFMFLLSAAIGLAAAAPFWRSRKLSGLRWHFVLTIALLLSVSSLIFILRADHVREQWKTRHWPQVEGTILEAHIAGERAVHPEIVYSYEVAGHSYRSISNQHTPAFGNKRKRYDVARAEIAGYGAGVRVMVHYNPGNPAESQLRTGLTYDGLLQLSFAALLFAAGVFLLYPVMMRRIRPES